MNNKIVFPLILIAFGILIIMSRFGIHLIGPIMGYLVPIAMIALGYLGIRKGSKFGWIIAGIGAIILLGKLAGWLVIILAIGLILYGLSMLKRSPRHNH
jgi:predicted membrane protein